MGKVFWAEETASTKALRRENPVKLQQSRPGTIQDEAEANGGDPLKRMSSFFLTGRQ